MVERSMRDRLQSAARKCFLPSVCEAFFSMLRFPFWKRFLGELQNQMKCLRVLVGGTREAEFFEYFSHCGVSKQNLSR